jgi:hypothetical protein
MLKKAAYYVDLSFEELNSKYNLNGYIAGLIHDEILTYIPGKGKLIDLKEIKGEWVPTFEYPDISYEYARAQEEGMKKAMQELLWVLVPDFPAKADCALGTSWADK